MYKGTNWLNEDLGAIIQDDWRTHWPVTPENIYEEERESFPTLEHVSSFAIDYCAAALNWVIDRVQDLECNDGETIEKLLEPCPPKTGDLLANWLSIGLAIVVM
ncbi:MAG: hypothetical protein ACQERB_08585 [Promethearchaeati archaeon]